MEDVFMGLAHTFEHLLCSKHYFYVSEAKEKIKPRRIKRQCERYVNDSLQIERRYAIK